MQLVIRALDTIIALLRVGFAAAVLVTAVLCILDWAARTRRISPFGALARFTRKAVDPLITAVERRIVRAGGTPASAPWWTLVFMVLGALLVLALLSFVRNSLVDVYYSFSRGPTGILRLVVSWTFAVLQIAIIVRVVTSWIGGTYSALGRLAFKLTEWFLRPLRRVLPTFGGIDLSPLIAWFLLSIVQGLLMRAL